MILSLLIVTSCGVFKPVQEDVGTAGAVVAVAGETKLMSKEFIDTFYSVQSELIIHDVKFKNITAKEAWDRQNKLNSQLSDIYGILDQLQDLEILLHSAVMLKLQYEKEGLEPDQKIIDKITRYGSQIAVLIARAANIMNEIKGGS
jgi:hypothetical protein